MLINVVKSADTDTNVYGRFPTCRIVTFLIIAPYKYSYLLIYLLVTWTHAHENAEKRNAHLTGLRKRTCTLIKASSDTCCSSATNERISAISRGLGSAQCGPQFISLNRYRQTWETDFLIGYQCCRCPIYTSVVLYKETKQDVLRECKLHQGRCSFALCWVTLYHIKWPIF